MGGHSGNARERIIDAAEQVVIDSGARHLTLEAVASKAGISRGGLLYHFHDKEALLGEMLHRRRKHLDESKMKRRAEIQAGPEHESVVYILSLLDEDTGIDRNVSAALVASCAHNPELLAPVREDFHQIIADLTKDGLSFERAAVIMLATNGLRLLEVLSICPFNAEERRRIIRELLSFAKENNGS
ncbi:MAG: TetR/AcrR family transcriptional regulator [Smithellaceae bacterium]